MWRVENLQEEQKEEIQPVFQSPGAVDTPACSTFPQQQCTYRGPRESSIHLPALLVTCLAGECIYIAAVMQLLPVLVDARTQSTWLSDVILGTSSSLEILPVVSTKLGPCPSLMDWATMELSSSAACSWPLLDYPGPIV